MSCTQLPTQESGTLDFSSTGSKQSTASPPKSSGAASANTGTEAKAQLKQLLERYKDWKNAKAFPTPRPFAPIGALGASLGTSAIYSTQNNNAGQLTNVAPLGGGIWHQPSQWPFMDEPKRNNWDELQDVLNKMMEGEKARERAKWRNMPKHELVRHAMSEVTKIREQLDQLTAALTVALLEDDEPAEDTAKGVFTTTAAVQPQQLQSMQRQVTP